MGGRYDATNVYDLDNWADYAIGVVRLDLDHTHVLGSSLEEIASEKGGIFLGSKLQSTNPSNYGGGSASVQHFALYPQNTSVEEVLRECSGSLGIKFLCSPGQHRRINGDIMLGLPGKHQYDNAEMAVQLVEAACTAMSDVSIKEALRVVSWPGRCQTIEAFSLTLRLDGAHTVESLKVGFEWYKSVAKESAYRVLVFNCSHERDPIELLQFLQSDIPFDKVYFCSADSARPSRIRPPSTYDLLQCAGFNIDSNEVNCKEQPSWQDTLHGCWRFLSQNGKSLLSSSSAAVRPTVRDVLNDLVKLDKRKSGQACEVFVTGSLYLVGSILSAVEWSEPSSESVLREPEL